jgi:two-component system phosphate regulon response regulator PhoB
MNELILVIEDDLDLQSTLQSSLRRAGYRIGTAGHGRDGLDLVRALRPDLLLLDINLPDMSGFEVCRELRASPDSRNLAVIMVTGRSDEIDRIVGFSVGADDYLTKPFSLRELLLRISALLRRCQEGPRGSGPASERVRIGPVELDFDARQAFLDGAAVALTRTEFDLLSTFVERVGRVQTRSQLLDEVWASDDEIGARTVDSHVKRLRQKLGPAGRMIRTIRGIGYCLSRDEEEDGDDRTPAGRERPDEADEVDEQTPMSA